MPQAQNDFYRGLLSKDDPENISVTVRFFEKALTSPNVYVRQAAAEELANLMFEGNELPARTMRQLRGEMAGQWAAAFDAAGFPPQTVSAGQRNGEGSFPDKEKSLAFLLRLEQGAANSDMPRLYILLECSKRADFFSERELAAIEGHYASFRSRYNEALTFFRAFQEDGEWPRQLPRIFIEYPNLINDLGRTFQYTNSGREGLDLFLQWETNLAYAASVSSDIGGLRYSLLFYAARIARRMGQSSLGISLFEKALPFAPYAEQTDACIWYILENSLDGTSASFLQKLEEYIPLMHNIRYFNDIMERLLHKMASGNEWGRIIRTFDLLKDSGAAVQAGFAWLIARAIEEGLLSAAELRTAAETVNAETAAPLIFMRIAYNAVDVIDTRALYYRSLSASALGEPLFVFSAESAAAENSAAGEAATGTDDDTPSPACQFLLDFFSNGASDHALRYIRQFEKELAPHELRAVAQALAQAGVYYQSMRLVSLYINREDYTRNSLDLKLMFPRPYRELIEEYAEQFDISPPLFFGLIRVESAFQSAVVSHAGAVGLTQLMPATAQEVAGRIRRSGGPDYNGDDGINLTDPILNVHIGSYYFNYLMDYLKDPLLSLMAYNGGLNRVRRWRAASRLPADLLLETVSILETRDYGRRVMATASVYEYLYYRQN